MPFLRENARSKTFLTKDRLPSLKIAYCISLFSLAFFSSYLLRQSLTLDMTIILTDHNGNLINYNILDLGIKNKQDLK